MSGFALHLLGPPKVVEPRGAAGPRPGIGASKCLALLAYLTLERGPHTREELAALLWGDSPDSAARASLRQALKRLRAATGDLLHVDRATVTLSEALDCDVKEFLRVAQRQPAQAAGFDVPRFFEGFALRHAAAFDDWLAAKRQALLHRYEDALRAAARDALGRSQWREAAAWAERWLACNPLSDEATRIAIEAAYLSGDRGAALAQFAAYEERLARGAGAGVKPSASLVELTQRIREDASARSAARPRDPSEEAAPAFEASLVGRENEWRQLGEVWRAAAAGAVQVMLIEGEAGVGKTRLAEDFLRWVRLEGATVLRGRGYDAQTDIPYGPIVEALRGVLDAPGLAGTPAEWLTEATRLLPDLRRRFPALPPPPAPADPGERWRLSEGLAQVILAVAAERPTVLFIDDLQWCDGETCALLHFLMRRFERSPVALLATLNLGELERAAAAARLYRALRAEARATVVALAPLSQDEVWRMIREMARIETPVGGRRLAQRAHEVTDGNPFYVIELLKTLFARGLLAADPETGAWLAPPVPEAESYKAAPMPGSVHDAIAQRVVKLPYELRDLLATIAVAGRGGGTELLSHVHGMSRLRAAALCDALVERRLLVEEQGVYRCAHAVIADVVRDTLTPARRRELHRAIALSLITIAGSGVVGEVAGEIARHAERGGERVAAYRYALIASDAAAGGYAFEDALSWLDVAAGAAGGAAEADDVNRRTAGVLALAGWSEGGAPPRRSSRSSATRRGIDRRDVDLEGRAGPV
ncbi:MAG: AAA family ATPase [Gemmatimonadales bacterium]